MFFKKAEAMYFDAIERIRGNNTRILFFFLKGSFCGLPLILIDHPIRILGPGYYIFFTLMILSFAAGVAYWVLDIVKSLRT